MTTTIAPAPIRRFSTLMLTVVTVAFGWVAGGSAAAQADRGPHWVTELDAALVQAKAAGKPVLVYADDKS